MIAQLDRRALALRPGLLFQRLLAYTLFEGRPVTTRGRWINPLVLALARLALRLPEGPRPQRPLFVLGTGRSGTSWLGRVLALHPELAFLNEPKALWHVVRPDQDVIGSYARGPGRLRLTAADAPPQVARRARRLHGAFARLARAPRVLDKYPEMLFRIDFLRAIWPAAYFVIAIRDGRATARSIADWSRAHGRYEHGRRHDWWGVDDRKWKCLVDECVPAEADLAPALQALAGLREDSQRAALEWTLSLREAQRQALAADVQVLRLEDLARAPEATLRALLEACELAPDERLLGYARATAREPRTAPGLRLPEPLATAFERTQAAFGYR